MDMLGLDQIERAFTLMGEYLRDRKSFGEIAVYGGSAILLQFGWRRGTQDVDAVITSDGNHGLVRAAADFAARSLGLERSWLSEAVAQYAKAGETAADFRFIGLYPKSGNPALRVSAARPEYLLAMKVAALRRTARGDRDFHDILALARDLGISAAEELERIHLSYFPGESLPPRIGQRLKELDQLLRSGKSS